MSRIPTIYGFLLVCSYTVGVPFCDPPSSSEDDLRYTDDKTFCDSSFCVCNDPFGRVHCYCPPEVQVDEVIVESKGSCRVPQETTALSIDNCENVTVIKEAFSELKGLQSVTLTNIKLLSIERSAFRWKGHGLSVNLTNVRVIPDVASFAFAGRIESVTFDRCYIGMIRAFAFSSIEYAQTVQFRSCNIANVESQAFKKLPVSKFLISESRFNLIPSRFLFDVDIENLFMIESTFIDVIRTVGFMVNNPKVTIITDSKINTLESEALKIRTTGDVVIQNNKFNSIEREAFRGLSVERYIIQHTEKPKFKFVNNSITNYEEKSFFCNRTSFEPYFSQVLMDEVCSCDNLIKWRDMIHDRETTSEKSLEEDVEPFWCHIEDRELDLEYVSGKEYYQSHCTTLTKSIFFFVVIITATAVSLALIISFIICFVRRRRKWNLVPSTAAHEEQNQKEPREKTKSDIKLQGAKAIIVPDGRTYRETEFHVIVEKAEPLEVGYIPCKVVRDRSRTQISSKYSLNPNTD